MCIRDRGDTVRCKVKVDFGWNREERYVHWQGKLPASALAENRAVFIQMRTFVNGTGGTVHTGTVPLSELSLIHIYEQYPALSGRHERV